MDLWMSFDGIKRKNFAPGEARTPDLRISMSLLTYKYDALTDCATGAMGHCRFRHLSPLQGFKVRLPFFEPEKNVKLKKGTSCLNHITCQITAYSRSGLAWPCGPMDKASDYESGDSRFESWHGRKFSKGMLLIL